MLDVGPGDGSFPWWAFVMMPLMMLGMAAMMWFTMRMMMGMGGHGAGHGSPDPTEASLNEQATGSDVDSLRRQLAELQERLAAMETGSETQPPRSEEGEDH